MALITDLDPERIEEHDRIDQIQRPVLPVPDLLKHCVGDPAVRSGDTSTP